MRRAQLSLTAVEAALGVVLVTALAVAFVLGSPGASEAETEAQLDTYAADAAVLLANEPPRHAEQTRLAEVTASRQAFERERDALERRIERILPANLLFRVETRYGTAGQPLPDGVTTGERTVLTTNGEVTLRVWYA
jgi:hypothetical protein